MVVGSYSYPFQFDVETDAVLVFVMMRPKRERNIYLGNKITHDKFVVVADVFTSKCVAACFSFAFLSLPFYRMHFTWIGVFLSK